MSPAAPGCVPTPRALAHQLLERLPAPPASVLDPACGSGALLLAAFERSGRDPDFLARGLHGIELRPELAAEARQRLWEALSPAARTPALQSALERHIRVGDALDPAQPWPRADCIAANPPWISLSGRQAVPLDPRSASHIQHWCQAAGGGWPSAQAAFLQRIAQELGPGRRAALLLPSSLCHQERSAPLRASVQAACEVRAARDLGERAFAGVLEPAVLLELEGRAPDRSPTRAAWEPEREALEALRRLEGCRPLEPACYGDLGAHTGNAARELLLDAPTPHSAPVREGRDLEDYALAPARRHLRLDLERTPARRFRIPPRERLAAVPVLLRQTADRPRAALHTEPGLFRNSLLACTPPPELDPAFVVAVLNSPLLAAWHRARTADARQRAFPQLKIAHLRALPFPIRDRAEAPDAHDRIARLVRASGAGARAEIDALVLALYGCEHEDRAQLEAALGRPAPSALS